MAPPVTVWTIEKIVPGGAGMARLSDGRVGFASGALPGERIEVGALQMKKSYVTARAFRVLQPSEARVAPACAFAAACGGCDFLHVEYTAQLSYKAAMIQEALARTAGLRALPRVEVEPSPEVLGYRSRIRLHLDPEGRVGFHARQSHELVEISACVVARPELSTALARLRRLVREHRAFVRPYSEAELRWAPAAARVSCRLTLRSPALQKTLESTPLLKALAEDFDLSVPGIVSSSKVIHRWPLVEGLSLDVPVEAFVQVNWQVNQSIVSAVCRGAAARAAETFLDLYSGAGNFALALLNAGLTGHAVETQPDAVHAAQRSLRARGLSPDLILVQDAAAALRARIAAPPIDLLVLDPPRSGAAELVDPIARARPRWVAYCSCDPVTLSRDLGALLQRGYVVESVRGFDMFPGTHHVETLAWLRRSDVGPTPSG